MLLYSGPFSMFGAKAEIALREKELAFQLEFVPFNFIDKYSPTHPEVIRINPHKRQVPVLVDDAVEIFDSTQIFEYLEEISPQPALWPSDRKCRAIARRMELQADEVFFTQVIQRMRPRLTEDDNARAKAAKDSLLAYYDEMDRLLTSTDYLAGPYSYADISLFTAQLFASVLGVPAPSNCARLIQWRQRVESRPAVSLVAERMSNYFRDNALTQKIKSSRHDT